MLHQAHRSAVRRRSLLAICTFVLGISQCSFFTPVEEVQRDAPPGVRLESMMVPSGERRIHVVFAGDRNLPPALFVHGSPGSWSAYRDYLLRSDLLERYCLIALDRPGFGLSAGDAEPSLSLQARAAFDALRAVSAKPALLIGHSYGGPVVVRMAMERPGEVRGLLVVAGSLDPQAEELAWFNSVASWSAVRWILPRDWDRSNQEIMPLRGELEAMAPLWPRITAPITVLQGDRDSLVPPQNGPYILKQAPQRTTLRMLAGVGHFVLWEDPPLISDALLSLGEATGACRLC